MRSFGAASQQLWSTYLRAERWRDSDALPTLFENPRQARQHLDRILIQVPNLGDQYRHCNVASKQYPEALLKRYFSLQAAESSRSEAYQASLPLLLARANYRTLVGVHLLGVFHTMISIMLSTLLAAPSEVQL